MTRYGDKPEHSPQRLLLAAKTALILLDHAQSLLWALYPDEFLAISDEDHRKILEYLAMASANEAWPGDCADNPDEPFWGT
jgi:hypothetical protein